MTASQRVNIPGNKVDKLGVTSSKANPSKAKFSTPDICAGRKCLTQKSQKVEMIKTANRETIDTRKLADILFGCGRTQIVKILENKEELQ